VNEKVGVTVLGGDEAVSLLVVEPLDGAVLAVGGGGGVWLDLALATAVWLAMRFEWGRLCGRTGPTPWKESDRAGLLRRGAQDSFDLGRKKLAAAVAARDGVGWGRLRGSKPPLPGLGGTPQPL
jgi:hypothetical protein